MTSHMIIPQMHTKSEISDKCLKYLCEQHTKPGRFYLLPKIHKNKLPPPGRPIISAIGSPTEKISQFVDFFLQPMLPKMKSYVKDTGHFLYLLEKIGPLPDNIIIGTLDVTSLYTNVPLNGAKEAVQKILSDERNPDSNPSNQSLIKLLEMIFSMNNFTFSDSETLHHYIQINGVSMGSKSAPSVACLYMGEFERKYVYPYQYQPLIWLRYVDDIFYVWQHGENNLKDFITFLNNQEPTIQLTGGYSPKERDFLDSIVYIENNRLKTKLYIKPTNSMAYLHRDSFHANSTFKSLPYGEFIRARRNCSEDQHYELFSSKMKEAFLARGYNEQELETARLKAATQNRSAMLEKYNDQRRIFVAPSDSSQPTTVQDTVRFITKYHPENGKIKNILTKNWDILGTSNSTKELFDAKLQVCFRRNKRIRDHLVHSSLPITPALSMVKQGPKICKTRNCSYCRRLDTTGKITSTSLNKTFTAKEKVTCRSSNLVYCIQCKICNKQYVGETLRTFHERFYEHSRNVITLNKLKTFGLHFSLPDHCNRNNPNDYLKAWIVAYITAPPKSSDALQHRRRIEDQWVHRLRTQQPIGLNSKDTTPSRTSH